MIQRFLFLLLLFLNEKAVSQLKCSDLSYNNDSLAILRDDVFSGECSDSDKKKLLKNYFYKGILDSVIYFDKKGRIRSMETFSCEYSTFKNFYKNGQLKRLMSFKEEQFFGYRREYYKTGQIKYEAEYITNDDLKNDAYYTWNKKGEKFLHAYVEKSKSKKRGKIHVDSSYGRYKKSKVKGGG